MADESRFYEVTPTLENYWRAIILFGRNVASYKFALAEALFDLRASDNSLIQLNDLAPGFALHIAEHLKICDKQATSAQSRFLDVCRQFNDGQITKQKLIEETVRLGFNNVIDAFHNVHGSELPTRFFIDERKTHGGIRLTDDFYRLGELPTFSDLNIETEARWRLVETAWELSLPRQMVAIAHDDATNVLHAINSQSRRIDITSSRSALNGYQKGRCFYCFRTISVESESDLLADVDHFFPHKLHYCATDKPLNGVANLVLACRDCNRGANGKFDRLPKLPLLERLFCRNEYLIQSHHPLRETLLLQTGLTERDRMSFLQSAYDCATTHLIAKWAPAPCADGAF